MQCNHIAYRLALIWIARLRSDMQTIVPKGPCGTITGVWIMPQSGCGKKFVKKSVRASYTNRPAILHKAVTRREIGSCCNGCQWYKASVNALLGQTPTARYEPRNRLALCSARKKDICSSTTSRQASQDDSTSARRRRTTIVETINTLHCYFFVKLLNRLQP